MAHGAGQYVGRSTRILTGAVATGAGDSYFPTYKPGVSTVRTGLVQVDGIGTATVLIEGRLDPSFQFQTIATFTADGIQAIELPAEIRARCSAYTSGTINVQLQAG